MLKGIGKYDSAIKRLCEFIKGICTGNEASEDGDILEHRAVEVMKTTPAERLLEEMSDNSTPSPQDIEQELAIYNKLEKPPAKDPILKFWSENESLLPRLATVARVTLSVPCSSATIERTFKVGVHQVTNHRSKLNPYMVEGIIITKANGGRVDMTGVEDEDEEVSSSDSDNTDDDDVDEMDLRVSDTNFNGYVKMRVCFIVIYTFCFAGISMVRMFREKMISSDIALEEIGAAKDWIDLHLSMDKALSFCREINLLLAWQRIQGE